MSSDNSKLKQVGKAIGATAKVAGAVVGIAASLVNTAINPESSNPVKQGQDYLRLQHLQKRKK